MNQFNAAQLDNSYNGGRKGVAYDWQSLIAADGVGRIEAQLAELVLEHAE